MRTLVTVTIGAEAGNRAIKGYTPKYGSIHAGPQAGGGDTSQFSGDARVLRGRSA